MLDVVVRVALQPESKVLQHGRLFQRKLGERKKPHQIKFRPLIDLVAYLFLSVSIDDPHPLLSSQIREAHLGWINNHNILRKTKYLFDNG